MNDLLPPALVLEIGNHLRESGLRGESVWDRASADEDTVTGAFCETLVTHGWQNCSRNYDWRWKIDYKKYRGRGPGADERILGADGIVQILVENSVSSLTETKGMLFQAKKVGSTAGLSTQIQNLHNAVPDGAAIFEYGPDGFYGFDTRAINIDRPTESIDFLRIPPSRIGDFLADEFLPCSVGTRGLYYDAKRKLICYFDPEKGIVWKKVKIKDELRVSVRL